MGEDDQRGPGRVTEVLEELRRNTPGAREELLQLVYGELRRLAASQMRRQPSDHTLEPTALVHEAYLRLMGSEEAPWTDRGHFLTAAARAMRSILVDFARSRAALKRGGGSRRITLDENAHAGRHASDEVIAVHEALDRLARVDPQGSRVVELRFFGGLTAEETANVMGVAESTVYRAWEHARSWLFREIAP
jgi:RNA polymerase sigma factor (TIGR02999 family)